MSLGWCEARQGTRESSRITGYDGFASVRGYEIGLFGPFPPRVSVGRDGILCQVQEGVAAERIGRFGDNPI